MSERGLQLQAFDKGETNFEAGDAAEFAYVIQAGSVSIVVTRGGDKLVLDTLGAGEVFGEMALVDDEPRSAAAVVEEPATCILTTRADFEERLRRSDPLTRSMLGLLTKRLRKATQTA